MLNIFYIPINYDIRLYSRSNIISIHPVQKEGQEIYTLNIRFIQMLWLTMIYTCEIQKQVLIKSYVDLISCFMNII